MVACFSCHSLCENPKTYRVYYGVESSKPYAPGNYDEYNKKAFSEKVVSDEVCICRDCIDKAGSDNMRKYALKLWVEGVSPQTGIKCCYKCHHLTETRFCNHYKHALPWWVKYFIDIDKIEPSIDLGPVKQTIYCNDWKPLSEIDENSSDSLKRQFRMGLYLIKYYKTIRKDLKGFLFQDLFSFNNFVDEMCGFLKFNYPDTIFDRSYSHLFYKPYRDMLETNIYKKYYDTRAKLKDWAKA
jgi:hypothetical protein